MQTVKELIQHVLLSKIPLLGCYSFYLVYLNNDPFTPVLHTCMHNIYCEDTESLRTIVSLMTYVYI